MVAIGQQPPASTGELFSELVESYSGLAYNVAYRMLRDAQDAEDAVQQSFLSAYQAFSSFRGQSKLSTWLYRIVVNVCLMKIRSEKSRARHVADKGLDEVAIRDASGDPERAASNSELRDVLQAGLGKLQHQRRAAVVLRDVQGLSNTEAATVLGISVASLKSRLHRGRIELRRYLEVNLPDRAESRR